MRKKIGIITINGNYNYGNRLQNYALEQAIYSLGYNVETIILKPKTSFLQRLKSLKTFLKNRNSDKEISFKKMIDLKSKSFDEFRENYLNNVEYDNRSELKDFDRFIVGSDQVWNPSWRLIDDQWLRFAPEEKRFSYAASMATDNILKSNNKKLPKYLKEMNEISVRENESVDLVKKISGKEAKVVLDPTMLISKDQYLTLIKSHPKQELVIKDKYILVYSLAGLNNELNDKLKLYAKEKELKIVNIMGNYYKKNHLAVGPIDFIKLINNADLVISDSFHCGVFSIIMETNFLLFNRIDGQIMNDRISTLLSTFDLMDRIYQGGNLNKYKTIDFSDVRKKLEIEREKSKEYLRYILGKPI
ncbi:hypothetical protein ENLAB_05810 [Enterococcus innesii]|uniref:Polysaccharide pyruvyl transferase domain-containing protein n=2 Tax=Enterococcus innesii TaxID=2839759 RepID=A0ABM7XPU0_9ENTE|nr:hypothetical protein ENLAB_05810 [Enterococcus innesii]